MGWPPFLCAYSEKGSGMATSSIYLKGKEHYDEMATSPFCLNGKGGGAVVATSPFYLKGRGMGWPPLPSL